VIRRLAVLILLLVGSQLIEPLRVPTEGVIAPRSLFLFGILLLAADTLGAVAHQFGLPRIVGYLATGLLLGPSVGNIVPAEVLTDMGMMKQLAVGLIGLLAGVELRVGDLRERWRSLVGILTAEIGLVFTVLVAAVLLGRDLLPMGEGLTTGRLVVGAVLLASMLVANSPMIVLALLGETRARGPVAKTVLGSVLVADVVVILLFTLALSLAQTVTGEGEGGGLIAAFLRLSRELGLSLVAGGIIGGLLTLYVRFVERELALFAVMLVFATTYAAQAAHFEVLLSLMVAGFLVENVAPIRAEPLVRTLENIAWPVYVVFFALAGAELALPQFLELWPVVLGLVVLRGAAIWAAVRWGARWGGAEPAVRRHAWTGLVPQAGVAVGLATIVGLRFPTMGPALQTLALGVIAVNSTIGPILFRQGLLRAGEVEAEEGEPAASGGVRPGLDPREAPR
jgi:Kef-type K+ transport system membrane component KefB